MSVIDLTVRRTCAVVAVLAVGAAGAATPASAGVHASNCRSARALALTLPAARSSVSATASWTCRSVRTQGTLVNKGPVPVTVVVWANDNTNASAWTAGQGRVRPSRFSSGWQQLNRPGGPSRLTLELYADLNRDGQIQKAERRVTHIERPRTMPKAAD